MNAEYVICFKNRLRHLEDLGFKSHEARAPRGLVARKVNLCPGDTGSFFFALLSIYDVVFEIILLISVVILLKNTILSPFFLWKYMSIGILIEGLI